MGPLSLAYNNSAISGSGERGRKLLPGLRTTHRMSRIKIVVERVVDALARIEASCGCQPLRGNNVGDDIGSGKKANSWNVASYVRPTLPHRKEDGAILHIVI